jgi:hypothetical protein
MQTRIFIGHYSCVTKLYVEKNDAMYQLELMPVLKPASINERRGSWQPVLAAVSFRGSSFAPA